MSDTPRDKAVMIDKYLQPVNGKRTDSETTSSTGESEPKSSEGQQQSAGGFVIYPPPTAPYAVAKQLYQGCRDKHGMRTLLAYRGSWQLWRTTHWSEVDSAEVRARVYRALETRSTSPTRRLHRGTRPDTRSPTYWRPWPPSATCHLKGKLQTGSATTPWISLQHKSFPAGTA